MSSLTSRYGDWRDDLISIGTLTVPFFLNFASWFGIRTILLISTKEYAVEEVAGWGLSSTIVTVLCFAGISGLAGGAETIMSQAFGSNPNSPLVWFTAKQAMICFSVACVPGVALFSTASFWLPHLTFIPSGVADATARQLLALVPMVPLWLASELQLAVVVSTQNILENVVGSVMSAALCWPITMLCLAVVGYQGLGLAWTATVMVMYVVIAVIMTVRRTALEAYHASSWIKAADPRLWRPLLAQAIPSMVMLLSEWAGSEAVFFSAAASLSPDDYAAVVIAEQLFELFFSVSLSISGAISVLVANELGAGRSNGARRLAKVGGVALGVVGVVLASIMAATRAHAGAVFTNNPALLETIEKVLPVVAIDYLVATMSIGLTGVLRGMGHQMAGAVATVAGSFAVAIPVSLVLMKHYSRASVFGPFIGGISGRFATIVICAMAVCRGEWKALDVVTAQALNEDASTVNQV